MISKIGVPIEGFSAFSRKVAAEGAVLLKNNHQTLPCEWTHRAASYISSCQFDWYKWD
ncbi:hypothetical protein GCM10012290_16690 [Halolactibacillus alkaliphilus]|uniref:Uncharacterized protein n=1 Tax=Halolactibacillus alkaliphilus TaxID=442899 RepID=A0A511X207_9BACI|nr:hypothetical protein [Halolactibacillus alkaliphilus]GEN56986.1 hypothetical protein HAL01_14500 [Halolactibacillus alkaliphilus]GGN71602.1 hypothetical protein GCM10012290_16690 [Halolactibacillus alkaliphilus]